MTINKYHILGLMSGTSLDGVDIVYVAFQRDAKRWQFKILEAATIPYSDLWEQKLAGAIALEKEELNTLDIAYTDYLGSLCKSFIEKHQIELLDAVCSHGHTIFHRPDLGYTFQLGNLSNLSTWFDAKVVCDFRVQDVALGGQGAPLVPIGDRLLFSEYDACLNLGGFANISYEVRGERIAFDLVAVNTVMNELVKVEAMKFDDGGALASQGRVCEELLQELNAVAYYSRLPPKSLGIEFVNEELMPILKKYKLETKELLRTFVEHIAIQIGKGVPKAVRSVLVTGGGAYNVFLMERMQAHSTIEFQVPDVQVIEFKEAIIFGFLGVLKLEGEVNVLRSVTGASRDHSSGIIY